MMKRLTTCLCCLCPVLFASCDRESTTDLILTIGINAQFSSADGPLSNVSYDSASQVGTEEAATILARLRELEQQAALTAVQRLRADELIEQISALADRCCETGSGDRAAILSEAKLAALTIGTAFNQQMYASRQASYRQALFDRSPSVSQLPRRSVQRLIAALACEPVDEEISHWLRLHAATYPNCDTNAELFFTTTRRLADQERIREAVTVAREGLKWCGERPGRSQLTELLQRIYAEHPGAVGVPMNFAGPDLNGRRFELKSLRGNPMLVVFWATWCPACRSRVPMINEIEQRYADQGLQVVGVSLDQQRRDLEQFLLEHAVSWPQVFSTLPAQSGWDNPIAKYYRVDSIPRVFLLDAEGVVVATGMQDAQQLDGQVAELLARAASD